MTIRSGVRLQFPKVHSYLKAYTLGLENWESDDLPRLQLYARDGVFEFRYSPEFRALKYVAGTAARDLDRVANALRWYAIQGALSESQDWLPLWIRSTAYDYWSARIEIRDQLRILDDYRSGKRPQYLGLVAFSRYVFTLANCLVLGWKEWAVDLARRAHWGLDHGGFIDGGNSSHRRTHHFVLRLIGSEQGWPERASPSCALDEPIFNVLVGQWCDLDPLALTLPLLAACDRHTHQARFDSNKAHYDLYLDDQWYVPFEVLSMLKLRELHGLTNPELDHPLMKTPLGCLPPPQPPYTDDLLEGVLVRARQEFPDF